MQRDDLFRLILLAAVWGASFLFLRIATPEFGPVALAQVRVAVAALFLLPILALQRGFSEIRQHWRPLLAMGALSAAVPFSLLSYSTLHLTGGFASVVNATTPLWGAVVAWLWLGDQLTRSSIAGLLIGFGGVIVLVWDKISLQFNEAALAIPAAISAAVFYGIGANYLKKHLAGVDSLVSATGCQVGAAILLLPVSIPMWPDNPVSLKSWASVITMGVACTGVAYILFFSLIAKIGPLKAISVTYLVPVFAVLWGYLFINELLTLNMVIGSIVILFGTAMTTSLLWFDSSTATWRLGHRAQS